MVRIALGEEINIVYKDFILTNKGIKGKGIIHELTNFEIKVMKYFFENPAIPISHQTLVEKVWMDKSTTDHAIRKKMTDIIDRLYDDGYLMEFDKKNYALSSEISGLGYYSQKIYELILEKKEIQVKSINELMARQNIHLKPNQIREYLNNVCKVKSDEIRQKLDYVVLKNPS